MSWANVLTFSAICLTYIAGTGFEKFWQQDYSLEMHHVEMDGINKSIMSFLNIKNVRPNRTYKAYSVSMGFKRDLNGNDFKAEIRGLQFFHREYRPSPILFDVKVCDALEKNLFGCQELFVLGNYTKCPIKKGTYVYENFNLNASVLPPHLPAGEWQAIFRLYIGRSYIGGIRWFGEIKKIIKY